MWTEYQNRMRHKRTNNVGVYGVKGHGDLSLCSGYKRWRSTILYNLCRVIPLCSLHHNLTVTTVPKVYSKYTYIV